MMIILMNITKKLNIICSLFFANNSNVQKIIIKIAFHSFKSHCEKSQDLLFHAKEKHKNKIYKRKVKIISE